MRALLLLPFLASPALAQATPQATPEATPAPTSDSATFTPPQGCAAYLTVQMTSCTVSQVFRCDQDPKGWQRRVDLDADGPTYFGAIDSETQWMESFHLRSGTSESLDPGAPDPASFSDLIDTGVDTFDFVMTSSDGTQTRFVGEDKLTGKTVTIDGVPLEQTEYHIVATTPDGQEAWRGAGHEYISREYRMFLSGTSTYESDGNVSESDDTPVDIIGPGEKGFLSTTPTHGCGSMM